jgi:surface polysaccharide O-acyltransferase-like enzyme
MNLIKTSLLPILAVVLLLLTGFFPFISWEMVGSSSGKLIFGLYRLDWYTAGSEVVTSSQENKALAYLTYGIAGLLIGLLLSGKNIDLKQKLKRVSLLLSGAQLFAITTTAFRATQGLTGEIDNWAIGLGYYLSAAAFLLLLTNYLNKSPQSGE